MRKDFDLSLYLVTDRSKIGDEVFLKRIESALLNGVTIVQLREKNLDTNSLIELGKKLKKITDYYNVPLIIDDNVEAVLAIDAHGVHLGSEDMSISKAREILGDGKIIGATVKTVESGLKAKAAGADYFGVGAIFPTETKVKTVLTSISTLNKIFEVTEIPIVAIGGLDVSNIESLKGSSAEGVAVVRAIMDSENPAVSASEIREKVDFYLK
ncbi:thiamine phosphate synthase [Microaceticoccus formicicus]|uniref:thiamine phosphate synthase n=1 Tax=Microaceticoccus formicicus TaxID=3118105 RepID=UPI003CD04DA3|nr:thiamine phosphate synthase [Peptoniphilaceae bacterium AMB_02]